MSGLATRATPREPEQGKAARNSSTTQGKPPTREETEDSENPRPVLKLIKGNATEEELAALITVIAAMSTGAGQEKSAKPKSEWSAHHRKVRVTLRHGRGAWGASGLPR